MPNLITNTPSTEIKFDAIKLNPGEVMQIQVLDGGSSARHEVRFIGFIKDKSLLVTLPFLNGEGMWMRPGKTYVVRGFNGIHAYAFSSQVIRARAHPFTYLHFSWPHKVECQLVRHSLRVNVSLPAIIVLSEVSSVAVTMLDLSVSGTMLDAPTELGVIGDHHNIRFTVEVEDHTVNLELLTIIRNIRPKDDGTGFCIGIGFESVPMNDGLTLHFFTNALAHKTHD